MIDITRHPCFNSSSKHSFGRVHLPVAPRCNVQCNFCDRRFACAGENRPGVTVSLLSPRQAAAYLDKAVEIDPRISVAGIAGPGDPLANAEKTLETMRLVRQAHPEILLCVATNGLALPGCVDDLANLETSHVSVTVNAVDPAIGAKVYAWIRDGKKIYRGADGAALLLERQLEGIAALKKKGTIVKINTIVIPGVNEDHVIDVARSMKDAGADMLNMINLYPVEGTPFGGLEEPSIESMAALREEAEEHLPQMRHCTRCRADAAGLLGQDDPRLREAVLEAQASSPGSGAKRPYVAAVSREGALVNEHLGEARNLWVYDRGPTGFRLIERRPAPPPGGGWKRWADLAAQISDCRAILVSSAGDAPQNILSEHGLQVIQMDGLIEEGLESVYGGTLPRAPLRQKQSCGSGCAGDGMGCG
jgi:nitrogen fixation protein NifB